MPHFYSADELVYEHGGTAVNIQTEMVVLPHRKLAVFTNCEFGQPTRHFIQSQYSIILSMYLMDSLIQNSSFVTENNVCSLFKPIVNGASAFVQRRQLTVQDEAICIGK